MYVIADEINNRPRFVFAKYFPLRYLVQWKQAVVSFIFLNYTYNYKYNDIYLILTKGWKMIKPQWFLFCCLFTVSSAWGNTMPFPSEATVGFRETAKIATSERSTTPLYLINKKNSYQHIQKELDSLFFWNSSKVLIVAKGSSIIYEKYGRGIDESITPLGYSMSKSLTAIAVGHAICDGFIKDIHEPIKNYIPDLDGTSWGKARVKDLLMMSSGSIMKTQNTGNRDKNMSDVFYPSIYFGKMDKEYIQAIKNFDEKAFTPGKKYVYNNFDTLVLGLLVENAASKKFAEYFSEKVWQTAGAEFNGAWLINNLNQTSTYQGFSARPHDWLRLGIYVLNEMKKEKSCISEFLTEMTSPQIDTGLNYYKKYGYQTLIPNQASVDFAFQGFYGQFLLFNKEKNLVLFHHATSSNLMGKRTFNAMNKLVGNIEVKN